MTKEIRLNAFDMNCVGHIQHGSAARGMGLTAQPDHDGRYDAAVRRDARR